MSELTALLAQFHGAILANDAQPMLRALHDNGRISPERQMAIYLEGYRLRLLGALRSDYPELAALLGEEGFDGLGLAYIEDTAPAHASLDFYPFGFADFVRRRLNGFAGELAVLEGAIARVFLLPDSEALSADAFLALAPEAFAELRLQLREASVLMALDYPVEPYFLLMRAGEAVEMPLRAISPMMIVRHENEVRRHVLHPVAFVLLSALQAGMGMGEALEQASGAEEDAMEVLTQQLQQWFAQWALEGFFQHSGVTP